MLLSRLSKHIFPLLYLPFSLKQQPADTLAQEVLTVYRSWMLKFLEVSIPILFSFNLQTYGLTWHHPIKTQL